MAKHRSAAVSLTIVPIVAAAFLAGCGEEEEQETAYCVDENQQVIDNSNCDREYDGVGGGGFFWFFVGSSFGRGLGPGSRITGIPGDRVRASDRAALARRGGFGSRARSGGVGRSSGTRSSGGGGFFGRSGGG